MAHPIPLPEGYVLEGRYVLGSVSRKTAGGIVYTAFDKKLRIMVEVLEYTPADCGLHRKPGETELRGDSAFAEKRMRLLADGSSRMHSADSNIYDVLSANGTAYLVHVAPKNNAVSAQPAADSGIPNDTPETAAEQTRVVDGLFSHEDTGTAPAAESFSDAAEHLPAPSVQPNTDEVPVPSSVPAPASSPAEADSAEERTGGPSVRLLLILLAAGILLLVICCVVFISSLFRITDLPGGTDSLLGIPYTELADATDEDWLVIGRGSNDGYAPGMVVAEEEGKNGFRILINGHTPSYIMPDMTGMTADGAAALLNRTPFTNAAGLVQGQVTVEWQETDAAPHGMVLDQSPAAGSSTKSSLVTLTVADNPDSFRHDGTSAMADLVGQTWAETLSGHPILISDRILSEKPVGEILSQYPAAGSSYSKNAPCYVVVSMGSGESRVPDVQFMTLAEAEKALYGCGLSFTVEYAMNSRVQTGLIFQQQPEAGVSIGFGETVTLTVSGEGEWDSGPEIQSSQSEVVLAAGDTCTMDLGNAADTVYHSTSPDVVSVTDAGVVTALSPGSAVVTASTGGQTAVMYIQVAYEKRLPCTVSGTVGEKISLPALGDADETGTVWYADASVAAVSEKGLLTGSKAGKTLVRGEKDGKVSLYMVELTEAREEKKYVSIAKSNASDMTKMQKALQKAGLKCTVQEEYNEKDAGSVLRIQYTGYSDDKTYYFAEGTAVVLIVSKGRPAVTSVSVASLPKKTAYQVGEKLDTTGLTLKVLYADKSEDVILRGYTVSYDFTSAGRKTVAVSYGQRKTSFAVEVINTAPVKAELEAKPDKVSYSPGDKLDTTGLRVKVTYGNGTTKTFSSGFTTKYDMQSAGTKKVTVTYSGKTTTYSIHVSEAPITSIQVVTQPDKLTYMVGDSIDLTGLELSVTRGGKSTVIAWPDGGITFEGDLRRAGDSRIQIYYGGFSDSIKVSVNEPAAEMLTVLVLPDKLEYTVGEKMDTTGMVLLAEYENGKTERITEGYAVYYDFSEAGRALVEVVYENVAAEFMVQVKDAEKLLSVSAEKLRLEAGETVLLEITYLGSRYTRLSYTVDAPDVLQVTNDMTGLSLTGLQKGVCTITVTDGNEEVSCIVTVTEKPEEETEETEETRDDGVSILPKVQSSMEVTHRTENTFMPLLTFTGNGIAETEVPFTATVTFDPSLLIAADLAGLMDGVTVTYNGTDTIEITGTVTVPKNGTVDAAYIMFFGTDTDAYQVTIS